ncbi:head maturation protease, ClpP-related [Streptomyces sp. NPDC001315]|uniref:head maturation protease, ClpP-related n=1 Tax=Streptomyces sp. NPDC001315 TaxID=3364562 RepID=UPI00369D5EED
MNIVLPGKAAAFAASQREQSDKLRALHGIEARSWYRITNAASADEAEVMLYDEVGGWYGATADQFIADLRGVTAPNLRVRINSPGGSVFEGIAIANALRSHPASVTVQIDGIAASIASVIAMAGDRIEMAPNTMLMIHDASGVCLGNASDMEEMAELLDLISDNIADAYAARAGGTRGEWRARMRAETWYLPEDAVTAGLADEATSVPKQGEPAAPDEEDEPDMARAWDLAAYGYAGPGEPEAPKPGPPPAAEAQPTLVISIADLLDEDAVARLRAAVQPPAVELEPEAAVAADPEDPAVPEPVATAEPTEPAEPGTQPEPTPDDWTAMVASLISDDGDDWSALVSNLIEPDTSSSAATA